MVLAVLESRAGISFAGRDVYLNIAGGLRVTEPAADLAVAAALVSAFAEHPLAADSVVFGEISLSGALRPISQPDARLREAKKLGFSVAFAPLPMKTLEDSGLILNKVNDLASFVDLCFGDLGKSEARERSDEWKA